MIFNRAGDAAHSFPPTGGLGLNSGLGDVHNLAYKLAFVHKGFAGSGLLDSYTFDRRQVALVNSQQSVKNGKKIFNLLKTLGTTDSDVDIARRNLHANIKDAKVMINIQEGIEGQREHFDNLGLHIGYVYGDNRIPDNASVYRPVCVAGARLPHAWIRFLDSTATRTDLPAIDSSYVDELTPELITQKQFSTLDLCRYDSFTVLVDEKHADNIRTIVRKALDQIPSHISLPLEIVVQGVDFVLEQGYEQKWNGLARLNEGQTVLVRPDQHVLAVFGPEVESGQVVEGLKGHLMW